MKVFCWWIILAGIVFGCELHGDSQDLQENDLAVRGQIAKVCVYNPNASYDPAINPLLNQTDNYGLSFKDFCLWLTIANKGRRDLVFDVINAVWFFDADWFASSLRADRGKSFIIPPGGKRQFYFSTANQARKFFDRGNTHTYVCVTLTALKNHRQNFGPFVSNNFLPLINLEICDEQEIGAVLPDDKYLSLKFFLAADDFVSDNLKKLKNFQQKLKKNFSKINKPTQ